jgi:hypothetical protein
MGIFAHDRGLCSTVLELAKTCWNAEIKCDTAPDRPWLELASELLEVAEQMFVILGPLRVAHRRVHLGWKQWII